MNNFFKSVLLFSFIALYSCKPSVRSAADYNNKIVKHQTRVGETQRELFTVFKDGKPEEMKQLLDRFKNQVKEISDSVNIMPPFDGKDDFKKATLDYLDQMNSMAENECTEILRLYTIPDTIFSETEEKKIGTLRNIINDKTLKALNDLAVKQQNFAQQYHFKIE